MKRLVITAVLIALTSTTGCSLFSGESAPSGKGTSSSTGTQSGSPTETKRAEGIELTWEVPGEPVDGFVIRYGESRGALSQEVKVAVDQLQEEADPEYGPVYRYLIKDISKSTPIFVSIAAFKGDRISNFSEIMEEGKGSSPSRR